MRRGSRNELARRGQSSPSDCVDRARWGGPDASRRGACREHSPLVESGLLTRLGCAAPARSLSEGAVLQPLRAHLADGPCGRPGTHMFESLRIWLHALLRGLNSRVLGEAPDPLADNRGVT